VGYLAGLVILLVPYWLGPIIAWLTQKARAEPVFEPFASERHAVPEDITASFRQTCEALTTEGFHVVADLFQAGQVKRVSTRVALLENPATTELALAVAMFTAARPARLVASYAELPTRFRDGRSVSVHNSPLTGSFTPPPSRIVVRLPIVRDPARLCRIKRAYLERHYSSPPRSSGSSTRDFISSGRMGTNGWNYDRGASARARRVAAALLLVGLVSREGDT